MNLYFKESLKYLTRCPLLIKSQYQEVEHLYSQTPRELDIIKEKHFLEIFRCAYTKSPFYSKLYKRKGISISDIKSLGDISKLPIITKEMIREQPEELLTCAKWKMIHSHTSGTTGTPLSVYLPWSTMWKWQAYLNYYRNICGFKYGKDRIVSLRGHLNRDVTHLYINVSKTLYLSSFAVNDDNIQDYVNRINKMSPKAIEGYPSTLLSFCRLIKKHNLTCKIPIIFTSSEELQFPQRNFLEEIFGGNVFDHYGNTERTIELSENFDHQGYFEIPGYSINEYQSNCVITTSLINKGFPLIRYKVDDVIRFENQVNGKRFISSIDGRAMTYVTGKDGTEYNAAALTYVAKAVPDIITMQIVQNKIGELEINVIANSDFSKTSIEKGLKNVYERIGENNMDIKIRAISESELIFTKSKKLSLIINNAKVDA